ncbi:MAG: hypothetical protein ABI634_17240 [Acidobacteriota bacterium]
MTSHFSPEDQLAALDGTLPAERLAHASECASCQAALARTRSIVEAVRSDDVPEPSPLFWNHFSARVRAATSAEASAPAWRFGWRMWVTIGSAAAAFAMVLMVRAVPGVPAAPTSPATEVAVAGSPATPADTADAEPFAAVMQMASSLSSDDLNGVMSATGGDTPLVEELSPAERAAFVRLLHAEMEKVQ